MFVRFVVVARDEGTRHRLGVFQAAHALRVEGQLTDAEQEWFDHLQRWFSRRLPVPSRFARSRRPTARSNAVCWFKDMAPEHIGKVRELLPLLEGHGVATVFLQTERPGYIVYEDPYQVAAVPFRDTMA